jgi:uncharacterized protein
VVPIVNVLGVQFGSRYLPDRRDLNRSFPGSHEGSMAGRIARLLLDEVIVGSDLGIDLHTAANHRTNVPQVRVHTGTRRRGRSPSPSGRPSSSTRSCGPARCGRSPSNGTCPVLTYEGGGPLRFDDDAVEVATSGVLRVLARLGMIDEAPPPAHAAPMVLHVSRWLRAARGGLLELHVSAG